MNKENTYYLIKIKKRKCTNTKRANKIKRTKKVRRRKCKIKTRITKTNYYQIKIRLRST